MGHDGAVYRLGLVCVVAITKFGGADSLMVLIFVGRADPASALTSANAAAQNTNNETSKSQKEPSPSFASILT